MGASGQVGKSWEIHGYLPFVPTLEPQVPWAIQSDYQSSVDLVWAPAKLWRMWSVLGIVK